MRISPRALALAWLVAPGLAGAQAVLEEPVEEDRPGMPYALVHGGLFVPRGVSLEGFPAGHGYGAAAGYRNGPGLGFELTARRGETSTGGAVAVQQRLGAGMRLFMGTGRLERTFTLGFGWYVTDVSFELADGSRVSSRDGRLGFQLGYAFLARLSERVALGAEVAYGGAFATLFDEPAWVAGITADLVLRVAFPPAPGAR